MEQNDREKLQNDVKALIIERLNLDIDASEIKVDEPLFGNGLGLDSIDALELVVGLEQKYGISIPDEDVGREAFASVSALVDYIIKNTQ